ncbi:hypothetical protein IFM89_001363 [Coptis chinensis]|uniref:Uncharacterized protein n=1 Tax=Coptis chinensis TaxID=261450 RepID=A0A835LL70_9MAGN|nr:hypothetical protein IFM89_001363 [Coptis chinensis]
MGAGGSLKQGVNGGSMEFWGSEGSEFLWYQSVGFFITSQIARMEIGGGGEYGGGWWWKKLTTSAKFEGVPLVKSTSLTKDIGEGGYTSSTIFVYIGAESPVDYEMPSILEDIAERFHALY